MFVNSWFALSSYFSSSLYFLSFSHFSSIHCRLFNAESHKLWIFSHWAFTVIVQFSPWPEICLWEPENFPEKLGEIIQQIFLATNLMENFQWKRMFVLSVKFSGDKLLPSNKIRKHMFGFNNIFYVGRWHCFTVQYLDYPLLLLFFLKKHFIIT